MAREIAHGEVRLYRFPAPDKQRPVLVLTRSAALRFLHRATVAPITSTIRDIPTEVVIGHADGMKAPCAVNLDNLITVPLAGLGRRVTQLAPGRMREVCAALEFALGSTGQARSVDEP